MRLLVQHRRDGVDHLHGLATRLRPKAIERTAHLRSIEQVTGRLTTGRAALAGAASGAWFGLFIGLLVGLFTRGPEWIGLMIGGLLIGAFSRAVFGFIAHWATRGQRDCSSLRTTVADRYELRVAHDHTLRARQTLGLTEGE